MVAVRCCSRKVATSSSVIVICERWFTPMWSPCAGRAPMMARRVGGGEVDERQKLLHQPKIVDSPLLSDWFQ